MIGEQPIATRPSERQSVRIKKEFYRRKNVLKLLFSQQTGCEELKRGLQSLVKNLNLTDLPRRAAGTDGSDGAAGDTDSSLNGANEEAEERDELVV